MNTHAVATEWQLDEAVPGAHLGLIALDSDQATESDFMSMRPNGVSFYTARVKYAEDNSLENLQAIGGRLGEAASLILPNNNLDAIAYSCTSGTVALGYDEIARQIHRTRPGIPVVTPMTAAFKALRWLGISRVSLITPYREDVAELTGDYIEAHGFQVVSRSSFFLRNSSDLQRLPPQAIGAAVLEECHERAEAMFISCTGLRSLSITEATEKVLGLPVLSSNQCMFWECLAYAAYDEPIPGFGLLMNKPGRCGAMK
jgi:maleate isomerase